MAQIRPFRAWRYNYELGANIEQYTSPLFDVVTDTQLARLYANPHNSIHLSVPRQDAELMPSKILEGWKKDRVITLEGPPAIYAYYQHFKLPGEPTELVRKGFICLIKATPWGEGPVLRHEHTMPNAVKDRLETLRQTQMQVNPTHGLYEDPDFSLEPILDEAMKAPIYETEDYQGVRDVLAAVHDRNAIRQILDLIKDKNVVLADGHHRYEASVAYRSEMLSKNPDASGHEPWNWHMMYLTNEASPDLRIRATHRIIQNLGQWPAEEWRKRLEVYFDIKEMDDPSVLPDIIAGKPHAFGVVLADAAFKIRLKPGMVDAIDWAFDPVVKNLDLTVLHYYVIWRVLGIAGPAQRKSPNLAYERNFHTCLRKMESGQADAILVTNEVAVDSVRQVAELGETMPPKSTYFYPKVLAGFTFASMKESEFWSLLDPHLIGEGLETQSFR